MLIDADAFIIKYGYKFIEDFAGLSEIIACVCI